MHAKNRDKNKKWLNGHANVKTHETAIKILTANLIVILKPMQSVN